MNENKIKQVMNIGLTDIEARIYLYLLGNSPATGYKVARAIKKQVANTYQSLSELEEKGILYLEEGSSKQYFAVPYEEVLKRLKGDYSSRISSAERIFSEINKSSDYNGIYSLKSLSQVQEKFESMISKAKYSAVVDFYPGVPENLVEFLSNAGKNGVEVFVKTCRAIEIENTNVVFIKEKSNYKTWPGSFVNIVVDFQELLLSFISEDGKLLAVWSKNPLITMAYGNGLFNEIMVDQLLTNKDGSIPKEFIDKVREYRQKTFVPSDVVSRFMEGFK